MPSHFRQETSMNCTPSTSAPRAGLLRRLLCRIRAYRQRRRSRGQAAALNDYQLRDIGVSHREAIPLREKCQRASPRTLAFDAAMSEAERRLNHGDTRGALAMLQRAHVLGQRDAWRHVLVHVMMFRAAWAARDAREAVGQLWRLALLPLGHLTGRLPRGNPGTSDVGAFTPRAIEPELDMLLALDA